MRSKSRRRKQKGKHKLSDKSNKINEALLFSEDAATLLHYLEKNKTTAFTYNDLALTLNWTRGKVRSSCTLWVRAGKVQKKLIKKVAHVIYAKNTKICTE